MSCLTRKVLLTELCHFLRYYLPVRISGDSSDQFENITSNFRFISWEKNLTTIILSWSHYLVYIYDTLRLTLHCADVHLLLSLRKRERVDGAKHKHLIYVYLHITPPKCLDYFWSLLEILLQVYISQHPLCQCYWWPSVGYSLDKNFRNIWGSWS